MTFAGKKDTNPTEQTPSAIRTDKLRRLHSIRNKITPSIHANHAPLDHVNTKQRLPAKNDRKKSHFFNTVLL